MVTKKIVIPKSSLPPVDSNTGSYIVRYRFVSEDKNRVSHWSPTFITNSASVEQVNGALSITPTIITAVWGDELNRDRKSVV